MPNKPLTGYPSIDKPWMKYYSEEAIKGGCSDCEQICFAKRKENRGAGTETP